MTIKLFELAKGEVARLFESWCGMIASWNPCVGIFFFLFIQILKKIHFCFARQTKCSLHCVVNT